MAVWIPPVNIPSFSGGPDYSANLYNGLSGIGDAFVANRNARTQRDQFAQQQALEQQKYAAGLANADRNYALNVKKYDLAAAKLAAGGGSPEVYGNTWLYEDPNTASGYGRATMTKSGQVVSLPSPAPDVTIPGGPQAPQGGQAGSWWSQQQTMPAGWPADVTLANTGTGLRKIAKAGGGQIGQDIPVSGRPEPGSVVTGFDENGQPTYKPGKGSDKELKRNQADTKAQQALLTQSENRRLLQTQINGIHDLQAGDSMSTSLGGRVERALPWQTSGSLLASRLDTITSKIVIDTLAQIRAQSLTGGALGQVSNFEDNLLASAQGPLDPNNPDTMNETLNNLDHAFAVIEAANQIAYQIDFSSLDPAIGNRAIDELKNGEPPDAVLETVRQMSEGQ